MATGLFTDMVCISGSTSVLMCHSRFKIVRLLFSKFLPSFAPALFPFTMEKSTLYKSLRGD